MPFQTNKALISFQSLTVQHFLVRCGDSILSENANFLLASMAEQAG